MEAKLRLYTSSPDVCLHIVLLLLATLSDYQLIVKAWKSAKSIELPFIKGIKKIDFAENKNLEKITISGPFPTSTLPNWLKVPKVSFDPSTTKTTEWFGVHNASHLIIIMREHLGMKGANLSEIAKMKNLETLEIIFGGWSDDDPDDTFGRYNGEGEGKLLKKVIVSQSNV